MIVELRIRDFAVIEELSVPLSPGLNVVTGETGAGKSIVVDALGLLVGGRAASSSVRTGRERAVVEGVVDLSGLDGVARRLADLGLAGDEEPHLLLRREVRAEGRSRSWVNDSPATAGALRSVGEALVDIHGQHEHQRLLAGDFQQQVLDEFGGCAELADRVAEAFRRAAELRRRLTGAESRRRELESRADFLRFQLDEIEAAKLEPGEGERLRVEIARLANAETLARESAALHEILHAGEGAVADRLADATARVRRMCETDPSLAALVAALEDAYHRVTDAAGELAAYGEGIEHDPARLELLRERDALLHALKRKYGATVEDVIATGEALRRELDELNETQVDAGALAQELAQADAAWKDAAEALSARRREAADRLSQAASALFPGLGLEGGRFRVQLEERGEPSPRGLERVRFTASMNPGFPPGPLARIASGGELSRVMLALKSVLAGVDDVPVLVFDEIDSGVGGAVAAQVGDRLAEVAQGRQVLVVTHLARIAARASSHLLVEKDASGGRAKTSLRRLGREDRVREVARMLGGDPDSPPSLRHARELLGPRVPSPA